MIITKAKLQATTTYNYAVKLIIYTNITSYITEIMPCSVN